MLSIAADVRNTLGECPLWCERTRRLYWTDIKASELLALEEGTGAVMRWSLPECLGSFALTEQSNVLLMGLASRLALYDLNSGLLIPVAPSPGDTGTRIGDGRCDRAGNFVFGTMDDRYRLARRTGQCFDVPGDGDELLIQLNRITADLQQVARNLVIQRQPHGYTVSLNIHRNLNLRA